MPNGDLRDIWTTVNRIESRGCARREDDMKRIDAVEDWLKSVERKLDRIFYGTIGTLLAMAGFLLKLILVGK